MFVQSVHNDYIARSVSGFSPDERNRVAQDFLMCNRRRPQLDCEVQLFNYLRTLYRFVSFREKDDKSGKDFKGGL